jgi:hypothetical protein
VSPGAGVVVSGIGELSLGELGKGIKMEGDNERMEGLVGMENMDVDG